MNLANLYLISKELQDDEKLFWNIEILLKQGIKLIQYRQKNLAKEKGYIQANKLRKLTLSYGAKLIINDDYELMNAIDADGIHLGESDEAIDVVYKITEKNKNKIIGISCYNNITRVEKMLKNKKVDYLSIGAIFASQTKPNATKASFDFVKQVLELKNKIRSDKPIYAIGGITHQNCDELISIKANNTKLAGICVCANLFDEDEKQLIKRMKIYNQKIQKINEK